MSKFTSAITLMLVLSVFLFSLPQIGVVEAESKTIVVPDDYISIQEAIDVANEGDTIFVKRGTYYNQTLIINKSLSLIGEDSQTTILKGLGVASSVDNVVWNKIRTNYTLLGTETSLLNFMGPTTITSVVEVSANDIKISGFTIEHYELGIYGSGNRTQIVSNILTASWDHASISMDGSYIEITNNSVYGGRSNTGILVGGSYNTITDNKIVGTSIGIHMWGNFSIVSGNNIIDSDSSGIYASGNLLTITKNNIIEGDIGLALTYFSGSIISENNITKQTARAIWVDNSANNNVIWGNYIAPNQGYAVYLTVLSGIEGPINNTFHHNTIMSNAHNIQFTGYNKWNFWDNGIEGNYWSDYNGTDTDGDGIGDTPYIIDANNQDRYPLMAPITIFDAGTWEWTQYNVNVISNSTVSDFSFNPESALIRFNIDGEDGTTGFCRVTIPKNLLYAEGDWIVLVEGNSVTPTVNEDTDNTYLYFTYSHSTKTIKIIGTEAIPEFSSWVILLLFLTVTLVVTLYRKRLAKPPIQQSY